MSSPDSLESSPLARLHGHQGQRRLEMACAEPEVPDDERLPRWACMLLIVGISVLLWAIVLGLGVVIGMALAGSGP